MFQVLRFLHHTSANDFDGRNGSGCSMEVVVEYTLEITCIWSSPNICGHNCWSLQCPLPCLLEHLELWHAQHYSVLCQCEESYRLILHHLYLLKQFSQCSCSPAKETHHITSQHNLYDNKQKVEGMAKEWTCWETSYINKHVLITMTNILLWFTILMWLLHEKYQQNNIILRTMGTIFMRILFYVTHTVHLNILFNWSSEYAYLWLAYKRFVRLLADFCKIQSKSIRFIILILQTQIILCLKSSIQLYYCELKNKFNKIKQQVFHQSYIHTD